MELKQEELLEPEPQLVMLLMLDLTGAVRTPLCVKLCQGRPGQPAKPNENEGLVIYSALRFSGNY